MNTTSVKCVQLLLETVEAALKEVAARKKPQGSHEGKDSSDDAPPERNIMEGAPAGVRSALETNV